MKNIKGMSAFVTIVLSLAVIIIILFSSFGPGGLTKFVNKTFFENKNIIPDEAIYYDEDTGIVTGEGLPSFRFSGNNEELARQAAGHLASCWKEMRTGKQNLKCPNLCYCSKEPCNCRTLTDRELQNEDPLIPLGKIREYLKAQELREIPAKDLEGAPEALIDNWQRTPHLARTNILTSGSQEAMLNYAGIFDNINYLVCADYDYLDPTGDDLFITDDLTFKCE